MWRVVQQEAARKEGIVWLTLLYRVRDAKVYGEFCALVI